MRGATDNVTDYRYALIISIHAPHARSDERAAIFYRYGMDISIHAPHARSDGKQKRHLRNLVDFNPRSSCEERHGFAARRSSIPDFNPRSSCEERRLHVTNTQKVHKISIHAPHARSDSCQRAACYTRPYFNPRSSCEERPPAPGGHIARLGQFQSTLLMRGATCALAVLCGVLPFQSTLLMRGATSRSWMPTTTPRISIHAPHARSDLSSKAILASSSHFNPRSSCEERLNRQDDIFHRVEFQSTLLMRGATRDEGSERQRTSYFNPRSSCEERRSHAHADACVKTFQSTLLMRGATHVSRLCRCLLSDFNPRSSCEERRPILPFYFLLILFQSTLLMRGAT